MNGKHTGDGPPVSPESNLFDDTDEQGDETATQDDMAPPAPLGQELPPELEIGGRTYSVQEIEEFVNGGKGMKPVLTKKTQEYSEQRRAWEAKEAEYRERIEELQAAQQSQGQEFEYEDPASQRLSKIEAMLAQDRLERLQARQVAEAASLKDDAIASMSDRPHFNHDEIANYMDHNGLGPQHAEIAYRALYGTLVGQSLGERLAAQRGVQAPPVLGSSQSRVSPGWTSPHDVPGAHQSVENMSWRDLAEAAANDPDMQG